MTAIELPAMGALRVEGRDAAAFLQSQLAGDLRALADGGRQWNCYLTPQGRTQSVFVLERETPERFRLYVPEGMAGAVAERLKRYVLRSKASLALEVVPPADPAVEAARRLHCIALGVPLLDASVADQFTPHALSLERWAAFSTTKGCYPGQEIVARTHFLGRSKRALARLAGDGGKPAAGAKLADGGTIVCAEGTPTGFEALAVLHEDAASDSLRFDASIATNLRRVDFAQVDPS